MDGEASHRHPILVQYGSSTIVPVELVQALNQAYVLHMLAMNPAKVIPPGKSLISVVTREKIGENGREKGDNTTQVTQRVVEAMQAAFWDATAEKLSTSEPSEQNIHIQRLQTDVREAISSLLPPDHPLLRVLSLPPAPSSAPLISFLNTLKDVLNILRQRCAPSRDLDIDVQLQKLRDLQLSTLLAPPDSEGPNPDGKSVTPLAEFTTEILRATMHISNNMKEDLHDFLLGSMTEEQLQSLVVREAKARERDLIVKLWSLHGEETGKRGEDIIREQWRHWCNEIDAPDLPPDEKWKARLIKGLSLPVAISCVRFRNIPANVSQSSDETVVEEKNELPPQFFFTQPDLFQLQDHFQAIIITASLRSLTRLPPSSSIAGTDSIASSSRIFMQRIWTLLQTELQESADDKSDSSHLKLINLADEVVQARQLNANILDPAEEKRLREAVERTLRPQDPVFLLLQKRLMNALLKGITSRQQPVQGQLKQRNQVPEKLRTGRDLWNGHVEKRPKLIIDTEDDEATTPPSTPLNLTGLAHPIGGFEDPVLIKAIDDAFERLAKIVGWTESVWGNLV